LFIPQIQFMGFNSKYGLGGNRLSKWLEPEHWDPDFTTEQRATKIVVTGDIYPKLNANGELLANYLNEDQRLPAQARMFADYYNLGYRIFGFSEFCFNTMQCNDGNSETKIRDLWRGYNASNVAITGSLGHYLRNPTHSSLPGVVFNIKYFSAFERHFSGPEGVAGENSTLHRSMTRMQGFKDLVTDLRGAAPAPDPDPDPAPEPGDPLFPDPGEPTPPGQYWIQVSPRWNQATRTSNVIELRVDAYTAPQPNTGERGIIATDLPVDPESATITMDGESEVRRTCELIISDPTLVPTIAQFAKSNRGSWLTPHGTELHISRGFRYPDGTVETVPVGVFRIDRPSTPLLDAVRVHGTDYSRQIAEDRFIRTAQSISGAATVSEITRLIKASIPGVEVYDHSRNRTVGRRVTWEQDTSPWQAVTELALSIGVDVACRPNGQFVIRKMPEITDPPVWSVNIGARGVLITGTEEWDRERVFNAVIARGEGGTGANPVQHVEYDMNVNSPTYWHGPFGHRPKVYSSPLLATAAQCQTAARTILARTIAPARCLEVSCVPNPALDFGDVVEVILPATSESTLTRVERHMVWGYTMPLGLGAMDLRLYSSNPGL
jgi:hypothetical protein